MGVSGVHAKGKVNSEGRRERAGAAALGAIFDAAYYLRQYPDVAQAGVDPLTHFLSIGWAEGRNPCALFDTELYFERNPDVAQAGINPLIHYMSAGAREGRQVSLLFDASWYLGKNPDIAEAARGNPLAHYLAIGAAEGREANPLFDQTWYLAHYPDSLKEAPCALAHYAERGLNERLSPHPLFDGAFYLDRYPDVARAGMNPLAHFLLRGHEEVCQPHPMFDAEWYLRNYPDVAAARMNPLLHYVWEGQREGREVIPPSLRSRLGAYEDEVSSDSGSVVLLCEGHEPASCRLSGSLAVHLHLFHSDLAETLRAGLDAIPRKFDLFISISDPDLVSSVRETFETLEQVQKVFVEVVPNIGRDIAPMLVTFASRLSSYELFLHIHSKRSEHTAAKHDWAEQLMRHMLASRSHATRLLNLFVDDTRLGLAFPVYHASVANQIEWGANFDCAEQVMRRLNEPLSDEQLAAFPAGSFFVARTQALRPLFDLGLSFVDFDEEKDQIDGTLAHAIERLWPIVARRRGFESVQVRATTRQPIPALSPKLVPPPRPRRIASPSSAKGVDANYSALRHEVLDSGLWDEKWYLSHYYEQYLASKRRRSHAETFFPLDHYLQEGWRLGHEPSDLLPVAIDQAKVGCSKIEYFLNRLRFDGYQFDKNIWVPSEERIREYLKQKEARNCNKVIYTCIAQDYDVLMQPYFISDDWDYVCFTDDPGLVSQTTVGIWEIRPLSRVLSSSVRSNRWHKMHPHALFPDYNESIYVDGNVNILSSYIFDQIAKRHALMLLPRHFTRNCIYQEIDALLRRNVTSDQDITLLHSLQRFLEEQGFPREFGLSENNLIYRRHHDDRILQLMRDWWDIYDRYASRDQASLGYVFWKNGMLLREHVFANCRVNYRDFWVMKHKPDMLGTRLAPSAVAPAPKLPPAFARNNIAAVFSTNEQFIPYLGVAIFSLIENASSSYNYDIIILAKGLPNGAFAKIRRLASGRSNVSIRIYDTTPLLDTLPEGLFHVEGYVPVETYNKCFLVEILSPDYDRCVYLDSDILVLADIQELHDIDLKGNSVGASVNVANVNAAFCKKEIKGRRFDEYLTRELGVLDHNKYFQAGVVVLDMNRLRVMNMRGRTVETLKKVKQPIFFDQCIFNSIFYGDVCFFSTAWNHVWYMQQYSYLRGSVPDGVFFDYARGRVDPKIIHYAGKDKPQGKLGWVLSDLFWKYAYASPFLEDIRNDVLSRGSEVAQVIEGTLSNSWYKLRPRLLVHVHLFYRDQLDLIMRAIRNISQCDFDLFVTVIERDQDTELRILGEWKDARILVLPNVGYDVYPFLHVLKQVRLSIYDFVLKIHTKNARRPGQDEVYGIHVPGHQWRDELINAIVGSKEIFGANLARFLEDRNLGCIGAGKFIFSTLENSEERNYKLAEWRRKCGVEGGTHYVGGSMFLARAYPFERLKGLNMQAKDFESPLMGTKDHKNTAHIFERLFGIVIESEGFEIRGSMPTGELDQQRSR